MSSPSLLFLTLGAFSQYKTITKLNYEKNENKKKLTPVLGSGCICTGVVCEGTCLEAGGLSRGPPSCVNRPGKVEGRAGGGGHGWWWCTPVTGGGTCWWLWWYGDAVWDIVMLAQCRQPLGTGTQTGQYGPGTTGTAGYVYTGCWHS